LTRANNPATLSKVCRHLTFSLGQTMEEGLWDLRQRHKFIDLLVHVDNRAYECHKLVLSVFPGYFSDLLSLDFAETYRDEITVSIADPRGDFEHVLRFLYTKDTSFLNQRNAFHIWEMATYFRLPELKTAAGAILARININNITSVVEQLQGSPISLAPRHIIDLLAQAFVRVAALSSFARFPPYLILQVLSRPNLCISSDRQLVDILSSVHARSPLPEGVREQAAKQISWQFLTDEDWEQADWRPFISEDRKNHICEVRDRIVGDRKHIAHVLIALNTTHVEEVVGRLAKYSGSPVTVFKEEDRFFENPAKFGIGHRETNFRQTEMSFAMNEHSGVYFYRITFVAAAFASVGDLTVTRTPLFPGVDEILELCKPENVSGTGVFHLKYSDRIPLKKISFAFALKTAKGWSLTSIVPEGFSFSW
jgi:hypothetical protein